MQTTQPIQQNNNNLDETSKIVYNLCFQGTSYAANKNTVVKSLYDNIDGIENKDKFIYRGPNLLGTDNKSIVGKAYSDIKKAIAAQPKNSGKKIVINLTGFSRGACNCRRLANKIQEGLDKHEFGSDISAENLEVNIFGLDPVAGPGDKNDLSIVIIPQCVKKARFLLAKDVTQSMLKANGFGRTILANPCNTKLECETVNYTHLTGSNYTKSMLPNGKTFEASDFYGLTPEKKAFLHTAVVVAEKNRTFLANNGTKFKKEPVTLTMRSNKYNEPVKLNLTFEKNEESNGMQAKEEKRNTFSPKAVLDLLSDVPTFKGRIKAGVIKKFNADNPRILEFGSHAKRKGPQKAKYMNSILEVGLQHSDNNVTAAYEAYNALFFAIEGACNECLRGIGKSKLSLFFRKIRHAVVGRNESEKAAKKLKDKVNAIKKALLLKCHAIEKRCVTENYSAGNSIAGVIEHADQNVKHALSLAIKELASSKNEQHTLFARLTDIGANITPKNMLEKYEFDLNKKPDMKSTKSIAEKCNKITVDKNNSSIYRGLPQGEKKPNDSASKATINSLEISYCSNESGKQVINAIVIKDDSTIKALKNRFVTLEKDRKQLLALYENNAENKDYKLQKHHTEQRAVEEVAKIISDYKNKVAVDSNEKEQAINKVFNACCNP